MYRILAVNPGSTSTKIAVYENGEEIFKDNIPVDRALISENGSVLDQLGQRFELIRETLNEKGILPDSFNAVVGRGGILAPIPSGTYVVTKEMTDYLTEAPRGEHASNLGAFIALKFAEMSGCKAYIVDPVSVDELTEVARISGTPEIRRSSLVHALNQKAVARKTAEGLGKRYDECRFVVAHLGTGITIGVHCEGKIVDVVGAKADGPFSPERAGGLPVGELVDLIFSGRYSEAELKKKLLSGWGIVAYLGTRDIREVFRMSEKDPEAALILEAFVYQIAKGIGELCTVLDGEIDSIVLTGGMAHSERLMEMLVKKIKFLAPVAIVPGENELEALCKGAERVLMEEERARLYPSGEFVGK